MAIANAVNLTTATFDVAGDWVFRGMYEINNPTKTIYLHNNLLPIPFTINPGDMYLISENELFIGSFSTNVTLSPQFGDIILNTGAAPGKITVESSTTLLLQADLSITVQADNGGISLLNSGSGDIALLNNVAAITLNAFTSATINAPGITIESAGSNNNINAVGASVSLSGDIDTRVSGDFNLMYAPNVAPVVAAPTISLPVGYEYLIRETATGLVRVMS